MGGISQEQISIFFLLLAWVPIAYIIFVLLNLFLPETAVTVIMLIVLFVYDGYWWFKAYKGYTRFLCPQCGKRFLSKERSFWGTRLEAKCCMNCGAEIPKRS